MTLNETIAGGLRNYIVGIDPMFEGIGLWQRVGAENVLQQVYEDADSIADYIVSQIFREHPST